MKRTVSETDINRLLAAPLRSSTPEFDRRFAELADRLAHPPSASAGRPRLRRWVWWTASMAAAAAAVALWLNVAAPAPAADHYALLLELDASLAAATPLLDPLNRELCLVMPSTTATPSRP